MIIHDLRCPYLTERKMRIIVNIMTTLWVSVRLRGGEERVGVGGEGVAVETLDED